jgi:hypothetical protein
MDSFFNYATVSWANFFKVVNVLRQNHLVPFSSSIVCDSLVVYAHLDAFSINFDSVFVSIEKYKLAIILLTFHRNMWLDLASTSSLSSILGPQILSWQLWNHPQSCAKNHFCKNLLQTVVNGYPLRWFGHHTTILTDIDLDNWWICFAMKNPCFVSRLLYISDCKFKFSNNC